MRSRNFRWSVLLVPKMSLEEIKLPLLEGDLRNVPMEEVR